MEKKRILVLSTAYYPFVGGAEVAIKEITDRLGDDFVFDLITAKLDNDLPSFEKIGNVNVYRVGMGKSIDKLFLPVLGFLKINRLSKNNNYYCMWGMMVSYGTLSGVIYNLFRKITLRKTLPLITTLQEGDSEMHLNFRWFGLINLSWYLTFKNTKILTAISSFLINRAKNKGYKGQSFLVPNGVDVSLFSKEITENDKQEIKNKLSKKESDVYLVTTSRLTYKNAVDDIINSLIYLKNNIHLIVIGKGDLGPSLQKQVDNLGLGDRVKFLGFVQYDNLPKYLSICDIFIRPSRSEGFGNSFIEAMAVGLPVIATPVGGIPDFLEDKVTGVFCNPDNPKSIARIVESLIQDDELKSRMVVNAKKMVREKYDWNTISLLMKSVFDKMPN